MTIANTTLEDHFRQWRLEVTASGWTDRQAAARAISRLYELIGRENPTIIFCQSPFQLMLMPSLVINLLNSEPWYLLADKLRQANLTGETLEKAWDLTWIEIEDNIIRPLLHQVLRNLRKVEEHAELLAPLLDTLKEQLLQRLKAGRYELTELQLHKHAYRQAWLVQEWLENSASRTLWQFMDRMPILLETLRAEHPDEVDPAFYQAQLNEYGFYSLRLEDAIVTTFFRMGAESVSQTYSVVHITHIARWLAEHLLWQNVPEPLPREQYQLDTWIDVVRNVHSFMVLEDICFVCERPTRLAVNEWGALHNSSGPALAYRDGFKVYAWNGVFVPSEIIDFPSIITPQRIDGELNAEVRRVMIELYGQSRYLLESQAEIIDEDEFGVLYRKRLERDEPLVMVKVVNSTPEPDGTFKDYFLRVPPDTQTARAAVAWTFQLEDEEYAPDQQT